MDVAGVLRARGERDAAKAWLVVVVISTLMFTCGCKAQGQMSACPPTVESVSIEALQGWWAWEDTYNGRRRTWLLELSSDGHSRSFVRSFGIPGETGPLAGDDISRGTFGRWFIVNRILGRIKDGIFFGGAWDAEKRYTIETDAAIDGSALSHR